MHLLTHIHLSYSNFWAISRPEISLVFDRSIWLALIVIFAPSRGIPIHLSDTSLLSVSPFFIPSIKCLLFLPIIVRMIATTILAFHNMQFSLTSHKVFSFVFLPCGSNRHGKGQRGLVRCWPISHFLFPLRGSSVAFYLKNPLHDRLVAILVLHAFQCSCSLGAGLLGWWWPGSRPIATRKFVPRSLVVIWLISGVFIGRWSMMTRVILRQFDVP